MQIQLKSQVPVQTMEKAISNELGGIGADCIEGTWEYSDLELPACCSIRCWHNHAQILSIHHLLYGPPNRAG